ncbi:MAG: B12-binding domain-containing radical SAM protein [Lachnospiraceae bacterium]|nr:B12-binding domain-containing radical SAM protein [Lachnospiraceae bacterium]
MKILLVGINAKYIHSNPAIYSLQAYAKAHLAEDEKESCRIELAEYTINQRKEEIIADLYGKKPDFLAFSCYIWNWSMVQEIFTTFHKLCPYTVIWLGGPEVSFTAETILDAYPFLTGIMVGEGEQTFTEICRYYNSRKTIPLSAEKKEEDFCREESGGIPYHWEIPGVVTRQGRGPVRELTELNEIPFFYQDMEAFQNRIVYYESSRGCPYRCSYCLSAIDKELRLRNLDLVKQELQFFLDHRIPQVKFIDRTFNANHTHAKAIWEYLEKHDNGVTNFHFEVAADILTQEETEILGRMRPGLVQLEIGVQSVNNLTLREINRPARTDKLGQKVKLLQKNRNIHLHLDLIAGLPKEDYESFKASFNEVYALGPDQLQLGFLKVLKGSPIWEKAEEYDIIYEDKPPYEVLFTRWLSYEELLRLKGVEEALEIYYNSGQFIYTVAMLEKEFSSPFTFFEELALFMKGEAAREMGHARSKRYELLLSFIRKKIPYREEMYIALLTYDLYLREKIKTRPEFCVSLEGIREESRCFYQQEEKERSFLPDYQEFNSKQLAKMTHLEGFNWSVWEKGNCKRLQERRLVLFDYRRRDPLTMEAAVQLIP